MCCQAAAHDDLRQAPREVWETETYYVGMQEQGGGLPPLELRNCRICHSTICRCEDVEIE